MRSSGDVLSDEDEDGMSILKNCHSCALQSKEEGAGMSKPIQSKELADGDAQRRRDRNANNNNAMIRSAYFRTFRVRGHVIGPRYIIP